MALSIPTFYCISGKQSLLCGVTCWCFVVLGVVIDKNLDDRNIAMALKERKLMLCTDWQCFSSISHDDARSFVFISTSSCSARKKCFSL